MTTPDPNLLARQREALISLTAMYYIEEHELLDAAQLTDAKESLKALFLRTSGAETMLRRLIEVLKTRRNIQTAFSGVSGTIVAVRRSIEMIEERLDNLRRLVGRMPVSAEANSLFVGPFLSISIRMTRKLAEYEKAVQKYVSAREQEARAQTIYRVAQESRERLRQRLAGGDIASIGGDADSRTKGEIDASVNFAEAEVAMQAAVKLARAADAGVLEQLREILVMSQATMLPSRRDRNVVIKPAEDWYVHYTELVTRDPVITNLKSQFDDLITLYARAYPMFALDFDRLKRALGHLDNNTNEYFRSKTQDTDIASKREKLRKIEVLIEFLERAAHLAADETLGDLPKFSKALSDVISEPYASWKTASEELLPAKVRAEAEVAQIR